MKILPQNTALVRLAFLAKTLKSLQQTLEELERHALRHLDSDSDTLGHLEEAILKPLMELGRTVLEETAQKRADARPFQCPRCGGPLTAKRTSSTTLPARFGPITLKREGGQCKKCRDRFYPADWALGIQGGRSPFVEEMAALFVSKMPVAEASPTLERATGIKVPRSTLGQIAAEVGEAAQAKRKEVDQKAAQGREEGPAPLLEEPPFTMVLELDAWNIRERDEHWGLSAEVRARGGKPERWHWVYAGTVFRLSDRVQKGKRPIILSRGFASTRGGIDALREQLHAEALRHGLGRAARVLVIADGAAWIWNLADDRFKGAVQRLDLYHAKEHLWAVAAALYGEGTEEAKKWVKPLEEQMESGQPAQMIRSLEELLPGLEAKMKERVEEEVRYFANHAGRMDYAEAKRLGEPCGSGAIESTCRHYQSRFKRTGQFWTKEGDEGLMCIHTFWLNDRWRELFPHAKGFNPSNN